MVDRRARGHPDRVDHRAHHVRIHLQQPDHDHYEQLVDHDDHASSHHPDPTSGHDHDSACDHDDSGTTAPHDNHGSAPHHHYGSAPHHDHHPLMGGRPLSLL